MCWITAFADTKVIMTDPYPDRIWITYWKLFKTNSALLCFASLTLRPINFDSLKELQKSNSIQVFSIVKDFTSKPKQKNHNVLNKLKTLLRNPEIQMKNIDVFVKNGQLPLKADHNNPFCCARNSQKKTTTFSLLSGIFVYFSVQRLRPDIIECLISQQLKPVLHGCV